MKRQVKNTIDNNEFIHLANPGKENRPYQSELEAILKDVLTGGHYILGDKVKLFEENFANYCLAEHCISTASGTDALIIALKALGCGVNDKVITAPNAGYYSTAAIRSIGAEPVYVDICQQTMALSVSSLEFVLQSTKDIKCIIATHLFGAVIDIVAIAQLACDYNVLLLEDCSQAHGAVYKGKFAGTFGDAGAYSFYPTKNLGALGDGGAIITNSQKVYDHALMLRQYGWSQKYNVVLPGGQNSRMDEIQAAVLNFKLGKLNELNSRRKQIVSRYASTPFNHIEVFNIEESNFVAHLAIVKTDHRNKLKKFLLSNNIGCDIHFPILDYKQEANLLPHVSCKNAEYLVERILTIPCHPTMTEEELSFVINKLKEFDKSI
jgi:aminotransferase EvaB